MGLVVGGYREIWVAKSAGLYMNGNRPSWTGAWDVTLALFVMKLGQSLSDIISTGGRGGRK